MNRPRDEKDRRKYDWREGREKGGEKDYHKKKKNEADWEKEEPAVSD